MTTNAMALQNLFVEPVSITLYEATLLRKLVNNQFINKRELAVLRKRSLVTILDSENIYIRPGVRKFLDKNVTPIEQKRTIKRTDRQE